MKVSCDNEDKEPPPCQEKITERTAEEKPQLKLEEFECDVSVKTEGGMEKQEFLFTLYDLDGHGNITKDDIAGLVRSIYEAVGSSVKLPHSGSKTIKVRLTVSPDKKETVKLSCSSSSPQTDPSKKHFGVTPVKLTGSPRHPGKKNNLMTLYRQNLIHMIKTNVLEKNQAQGLTGCESGFTCKDFDLKHHHKHRHANNRDNIIECRDRRNHYLDLAGIENYNCKLADAMNVNETTPVLNCPYQLDGSHICSKASKTHVNLRTHKPGHHRSRSHDLSADSLMFRYQLLDKEQTHHLGFVDIFPNKYKWNNHSRSKSYDIYDEMCSPKLRPHLRKAVVANGHSTSPHHHKHRNREREHQRAMQQVASWIEREPLGVSGEKCANGDGDRGNNNGEGEETKGNARFSRTSPLVVEHHEHHHIHEHIHHHYHHYNEV